LKKFWISIIEGWFCTKIDWNWPVHSGDDDSGRFFSNIKNVTMVFQLWALPTHGDHEIWTNLNLHCQEAFKWGFFYVPHLLQQRTSVLLSCQKDSQLPMSHSGIWTRKIRIIRSLCHCSNFCAKHKKDT
jgi:hypothetical protein